MRATLGVACAACLLLFCTVPGRANGEDEARKVIDRAIKAHGGAAKIEKFPAATFKSKGKLYAMNPDGMDYTGEFAVQAPDKFRVDISVDISGMAFKVVNVVNGDKAWAQVMGMTQELDKEAVAEAKESIYAGRVTSLAGLTGKGFKFEPLGEVKVGDRTAVGVRVAHKGHRDINLFFDKKTSLLLKSERRAKDPSPMGGGGEFTQEEIFDDYKEVEGVQQARKLTILRDGKKFLVGETSDFKPQEKLDDSTFAKP